MDKSQQIRTTIRFRHWTRKGYAVFASLGQCVTIGQLRKNVTERALAKQTKPCLATSAQKQEIAYEPENALTNTVPSPDIAQLLLLIRIQIETISTCEPYGSSNCINYSRDVLNASCHLKSSSIEEQGCKAHLMRLYLYISTS